MYTIYKITNLINNKVYVGQTSHSIYDRFTCHIENAERGKQFHLSKAIRKYGKENFKIEALEYVKLKREANDREIYWIENYNANNRLKGYNMTIGGEGGNTFAAKTADEMKAIGEKISTAVKGKNNGNHTPVNAKDIITNEIYHFDSGSDCAAFLLKAGVKLNCNKVWYKGADHNRKIHVQSIFAGRFVFFYDGDELYRTTTYQQKQGSMPKVITNINTGETFVGITKNEALDHFNLPRDICAHGYAPLYKLGFIMKEVEYEH